MAPYARITVEVEEDRDEDELDSLVEELENEIRELLDRYRDKGFRLDLVSE